MFSPKPYKAYFKQNCKILPQNLDFNEIVSFSFTTFPHYMVLHQNCSAMFHPPAFSCKYVPSLHPHLFSLVCKVYDTHHQVLCTAGLMVVLRHPDLLQVFHLQRRHNHLSNATATAPTYLCMYVQCVLYVCMYVCMYVCTVCVRMYVCM